jgi:hypothetical protein
LFKELKIIFWISNYLEECIARNLELRWSSYRLNIETGRHGHIVRPNRKYSFCNVNNKEDDYHFALICPTYSDLNIIEIIMRKCKIIFKYVNYPRNGIMPNSFTFRLLKCWSLLYCCSWFAGCLYNSTTL